ncbi:MAG: hypothetical protein ACR2QC_04290 [Gammaproteobacteria bacterium]
MPWSSGTFSRTNGTNTGSTLWAADRDAGTKITAANHDTHDQDIADGVNTSLTKDGQNTPTANLPMGGFKHTNVAVASARTEYARASQVQDGTMVSAVDGGAANAYTATLAPAITAYVNMMAIQLEIATTNTLTSTLNINGVGAKRIRRMDAPAVRANDLIAGNVYIFLYESTADLFFVVNPSQPSLQQDAVQGCTLSNAADTDHDLTISSGAARDSTNLLDITVDTDMTKQLDIDWAEGTNQGGFPSALTLAADTAYRFFLIGKTDGSQDAGWDTSATATNLLADATGYTLYREIGAIGTDSSSNIVNNQFAQAKRQITEYRAVGISATGTDVVFLALPSGIEEIRFMMTGLSTDGTGAPRIQLGDSGGFEVTGYLGTRGDLDPTPTFGNITDGFLIRDSWTATNVAHGTINLYLEDAANNTWVASGLVGLSNGAAQGSAAGSKSLSGEITQIRIRVDGVDSFDAGTISVFAR